MAPGTATGAAGGVSFAAEVRVDSALAARRNKCTRRFANLQHAAHRDDFEVDANSSSGDSGGGDRPSAPRPPSWSRP